MIRRYPELCLRISIHAPREGSDYKSFVNSHGSLTNFYPRSPRGERPRCTTRRPASPADFYPRSPRGERHSIRP